ncbi:PRTRC system protein E [Granulicella arctica]|uniref:PRTRC system protein E n=1 Tax=Granulicella arctica TaxID=940613 RepID=UPI0021E022B2|nr:PRTRC system protein E [Granulicella arctica]
MFRELAPLLRQRAVLLTVTHLEEDQIRVNVLPKQVGTGENTALITPFSVTGTAEELDEQLPQAFVQFVGKHLELKNTLEAAKAEMDAAGKQAKEEAKSKTKMTVKKPEPEPAKPEPAKTAPAPGLFDTLPTAAEPTPPSSDEDEILKEIQANEQSDDDTENDLEDEPVAA